MAQAKADLDSVSDRLANKYPNTNKEFRLGLQSLRDAEVGTIRPYLLMLLAAAGLLLKSVDLGHHDHKGRASMRISLEQRVMRRKAAAVCWFAAAGILITSGPRGGNSIRVAQLFFLVWVVARIGFLAYTGILLWDADQETESLKHTQSRLEEIIAESQSSPSPSEHKNELIAHSRVASAKRRTKNRYSSRVAKRRPKLQPKLSCTFDDVLQFSLPLPGQR